jgi:hypothetical protein
MWYSSYNEIHGYSNRCDIDKNNVVHYCSICKMSFVPPFCTKEIYFEFCDICEIVIAVLGIDVWCVMRDRVIAQARSDAEDMLDKEISHHTNTYKHEVEPIW